MINVLDKGFVRLVDHKGSDLSIVRAARVSYDADWRSGAEEGKDSKLIGYMMQHLHTSPFEHVVFTFEVKAPIFVFRQWHRHRTWSYSELSARYAPLKEEFYIPALEQITTQSESNKQIRTSEQHPRAQNMAWLIEQQCKSSFQIYEAMLERGCPRELARTVLPLATYSRMFATVDLHNLMHFLKLRLHEHAQYEIRVYAQAILELIRPIVPVAAGFFETTL
jgi:thymidylate synthase (FAD)